MKRHLRREIQNALGITFFITLLLAPFEDDVRVMIAMAVTAFVSRKIIMRYGS